MSSSETSGQLNPGSKAYLTQYLHNTGWYKAHLLSLSGPLASLGTSVQEPQGQPQNVQNTGESRRPEQSAPRSSRPRIAGQITNVDAQNRSFSIRTERGDIGLKLPRTVPLPPEGLRIEIELPRIKDGTPPREGQNITFRPLPKDSQPAPIQQKINTTPTAAPPLSSGQTGSPAPQDGAPIPPPNGQTPGATKDIPLPTFKPAAPLVDTAQTAGSTSQPLPPAPQILESGIIITVRALTDAQIQNIRPLLLPASSQTASPQPTKTAAENVSPAPPQRVTNPAHAIGNAAGNSVQPALPQPASDMARFRLNTAAPASPQPILPDLATLFTGTKDTIAILRSLNARPNATPDITLTPASTASTARPTSSAAPATPQAPPLPDATIAAPAPDRTAPAPATRLTAPPAPSGQAQPAPQIQNAGERRQSGAETPKTPSTIRIESVQIAPLPQRSDTQAAAPRQPALPSDISTAALTAPQNAAPPPSLQRGEIVGQTENGRPVVAMQPDTGAKTGEARPMRYVALDMPATNVTQGTQITFTETAPPQPLQPSIPQAAAIAAQAQSITFSPHTTWPGMDDIAQTLQMAAPQQAQALMNQSPNIQSPAFKMEPAILFFLAAARSGDITSWLGSQSTDILRQAGKTETLNRIMSDFMTLSRPSQESGSPIQTAPEWRSLPLPLFAYNEAHKIMLHYKYDEGAQQNEDESGKNAMRFVIDLEMTKMGDVQLDGFAQKGRLDLIIRTAQPLSPDMQQIMRRKYSGSLESTGFHGELGFHGTPDKFIKIEPTASAEESGFNV